MSTRQITAWSCDVERCFHWPRLHSFWCLLFAAFTVDVGSITLTKSQLRNASDAAAHAATLELVRAFGPGAEVTQAEAEVAARSSAQEWNFAPL